MRTVKLLLKGRQLAKLLNVFLSDDLECSIQVHRKIPASVDFQTVTLSGLTDRQLSSLYDKIYEHEDIYYHDKPSCL